MNKKEVNLKALRESAGLTQREVSLKLQIAQSTIGFWEAGTKIPRSDKFFALAEALGVSAKTLARAMGIDVSDVPDDNECNH